MRVGLAGKGGVGKSTLAVLLADIWHRHGRRVLAVDTDADPGLGLLLGLDLDAVDDAPTLPHHLIMRHDDRRRSPADLIDSYGIPTPAGPVLLHAGAVTAAGAGCACGAHSSVRSLLGATLDREADVAIVDVTAGLESLTRASGTLAYADVLLVVTTPARKAVLTAVRTRDLARELGTPRVAVVGNRVRDERDATVLEREIADHALDLVASIAHEPSVAAAERDGRALDPAPLRDTLKRLVGVVEEAGAASRAAPQARAHRPAPRRSPVPRGHVDHWRRGSARRSAVPAVVRGVPRHIGGNAAAGRRSHESRATMSVGTPSSAADAREA